MNITHSELVFVALGIQAYKSACAILSSVAFFPQYPINGMIFERKKNTEHNVCVLTFSTNLPEKFSHFQKNRVRHDQKSILVFM
jgi:hypothetical protein